MPALLVLAVVALVALWPADRFATSPETPSSSSGAAGTEGPETVADPAPEPATPSAFEATTPEVPTASPTRESSPDDAPARSPASVTVVRGAAGKACSTSTSRSDYGDYPLARCTLWRASEGLLHGETSSRGPREVTCQRDLGRENPVFRRGQTNTWWVWTTSDDGTWDWYPETAVAQGASDQPINGIAQCQDAS